MHEVRSRARPHRSALFRLLNPGEYEMEEGVRFEPGASA